MTERHHIYVDGQWVDSLGAERLYVTNPATEQIIGSVPRGTAGDVEHAVAAAARAFPAWSETTTEERAHWLLALADALEARSEEITTTIVAEMGQPITFARRSQTASAINDLRIAAEVLPQVAWSEQVGNATVRRVPAGVVGAITPWNAPLRLITMKAGAALAAGCTVVLKGSEVAPFSSYIFAEAAQEAGLPPGVFNLLSGVGPEVGEAIAAHRDVDLVSLTGSVRAGSRVMELASRTIKRVALELGGKSATIVLPGADLETGVGASLTDAFRNSGQVCAGLSRLLVPRTHLDHAVEIAASKAESYAIGEPTDPGTTLGPVATEQQRDRVRDYIRLGIEEGLTLVAGGPDTPAGLTKGFYVRPTVFVGTNQSRLAQEEIFGPVVVMIPFDTVDEAIQIANESDYGLAGAVWAADAAEARKVASRLRTGRVVINGAPLTGYVPHGGFKMSGIGREWGRFGVEDYLEYQALVG